MSRSSTRTPPIRISTAFFSAVAALDDGAAAAIMRIAAHQAESGSAMTVAEFGSRVGQDGLFLHSVLQGMAHLLDPEALGYGELVVSEVAEGLAHRAGIAARRSEAANTRYVRAAAQQKAAGAEIKLTRGRVATGGRGAAAGRSDHAPDDSICTHVHNGADYAHLQDQDACTHVHNPDADAHMCMSDACTHVHNRGLDAHMCISRAGDSAEDDAHMCIIPAEVDEEMAENRDFSMLDRSTESFHADVRPPRADLSISNHSLEEKRVESSRTHVRRDGGATGSGIRRPSGPASEPDAPGKPVATRNRIQSGIRDDHQGNTSTRGSGYRPSAGSAETPTVPVPPEFLRRLLEAGPVDVESARIKLAGWIGRWGEPFVRSAIEAIPDKDIARPISYLSSILTNLASEAGEPSARSGRERLSGGPQTTQEASLGPSMPRKVKRRITMRPGASWELVGWTARNREGSPATGRHQVWRTESGDLRYKPAPSSETIPTYEEDPGVYAYD